MGTRLKSGEAARWFKMETAFYGLGDIFHQVGFLWYGAIHRENEKIISDGTFFGVGSWGRDLLRLYAIGCGLLLGGICVVSISIHQEGSFVWRTT